MVEQPAWEAMSPFMIPALVLLIAFMIMGLLFSMSSGLHNSALYRRCWPCAMQLHRWQNGQLKQSVTIRHNDELGQLAHSVNRVAGQLQRAFW